MARVTTLGSFQGGGPYRQAREGMEASPNHDAAALLQLNTARVKIVRWQIEQLHRELELLLVEEKNLLDMLHGALK